MPSSGYICALVDPRIPGDKNVVFVFNGRKPWETILRHIDRSQNTKVAQWVESLKKDFPEGIQILGREVCDQWHGDHVEIPEPPPGITRIPWYILDYEEEHGPHGARIIRLGSKKQTWIDKLRNEGHPLMNGSVGRPKESD